MWTSIALLVLGFATGLFEGVQRLRGMSRLVKCRCDTQALKDQQNAHLTLQPYHVQVFKAVTSLTLDQCCIFPGKSFWQDKAARQPPGLGTRQRRVRQPNIQRYAWIRMKRAAEAINKMLSLHFYINICFKILRSMPYSSEPRRRTSC